MSRDQPPLAATVPGHGTTPPSAATNTPRPDADPPDPGRTQDLDLASDMDVSITDAPVQTLDTPAAVSHAVIPALPTDPSRASTVSPPSYKDTLMASGSPHLTNTAAFTDNEEITLVDGDVTRSMVDGLISIVFSERVQALAVKNFELTVVVKLLGRRIGYNTLRSRLLDMWKPKEAFRLMDIENDYFLVTFKSRPDYSNAISGGPWVLFGHYLVVEPWTTEFSTSQSHPNRVLAWICLPGLPVTLYQRSMITAIGECIGPVLKIDYQTESGCRGRFARMAVSLDLRKPLVSKLSINGRLQVVEYESLPTIYFECGKYGHVKDVCPVVTNATGAVSESTAVPVAASPAMTDEPFGPWMKVERRPRRVFRRKVNANQDDYGFAVAKSRFNPIFDEEAVEELVIPPIPTHDNSLPDPVASGPASKSPVASRAKGKGPVDSNPFKHRPTITVRKPLFVHRPYAASPSSSGPTPSRRNSSLSNTQFTPFPRPSTRFNKSNHSAVVVAESDDPVILVEDAIPAMVSKSPAAPVVPNTLLGVVKLPNLEESQLQSLPPSSSALELEILLDHEELLWRQNSRSDWISKGDRNTSYFHRKAKQRKIRNRIDSLQLPDGSWCDDEHVLRTQAASFFRSLYSAPEVSSGSYPYSGCFPSMPRHQMDSLASVPSPQEVRDALCSMAPLKAPGPDGLHAEFFQKHWNIVGNDICNAIRSVFEGGTLEPDLHRTTVVLSPKVDVPLTFSDFRPISLCSVIYKLLTKIIVRRLKHLMSLLTDPSQTSFISGRSITENIILNQEIVHSMGSKKTKQGWMATKVDLEKAFDRIKWDFLRETLEEAGFPLPLIRIIMHCVSSSLVQVQWNGVLSPPFSPERGVRQGDPLSPYLFVLAMERLGHAIRKAVDSGRWVPFRLARHGLPLSHLFFADDLILYAKANLDQAAVISSILTEFGYFSGHRVNVRKSQIYFSPNTSPDAIDAICTLLSMAPTPSLGKAKLNGWTASSLSLAGRVTLASSVLAAIPTFFMQTMRLPIRVCSEIDKIVRGFIWGSSAASRKIYLVNWSSIAQPRARGGLGIPRANERNLAFMQKLAFSLISTPNALWVKALRQKYRMHDLFPLSIARPCCSPLWRAMSNVWDSVRDNVSWIVGNGLHVSVWNDTWVPSLGPLRPWLRVWSHAIANLEFNDLLQHDRQWDVSRLSNLLLPEAVPFIIGIPPPNCATSDAFAWISTSSGIFSVASAYAHLLELAWDIIDPKWSWVWSLDVTPRIRMFIWLVLKRRLMTNEERTRRRLTLDASCPCCGYISESITHILRDCPSTRALWCSILPPDRHALFFSSSLEHWLWKRRNDFVFTDVCLPLEAVYNLSLAWAKHFTGTTDIVWVPASSLVSLLQWTPPATGWVSLNADASLSLTSGIGTVGGVFRNSAGNWICGYHKCVGFVSILQAELWSVLVGLQVARSFGFDRLIVQSDSSQAIKLLTDPLQQGHRLPLVCAIESLCQASSQVDFRWIPRELNMVADCLSKLPSLPQFELSVISDIPESVRPLLDRDKNGPPYSRRGRGVT
ncbi:hypothetical protein GQ457_13G020550 [Hibiscus cannabinus]